ncbi:hypothetical protein GCM10007978_11990 [Shewanella hanedai]|nr:hypothetical protein GCM10007978_11990 [Shewanella hanedai]
MIVNPNIFRFIMLNTVLRMFVMFITCLWVLFCLVITTDYQFSAGIIGFILIFSFLIALVEDGYIFLFNWYSLALNHDSSTITVFNRGVAYQGSYIVRKKTLIDKMNKVNIYLIDAEHLGKSIKVNSLYLSPSDASRVRQFIRENENDWNKQQ